MQVIFCALEANFFHAPILDLIIGVYLLKLLSF